MKNHFFTFVCFILFTARCFADSYSINVQPGFNLIANQLDHVGGNSLTNLFPVGTLPDGSEILIWNCSGYVGYYSDSGTPSGWDNQSDSPLTLAQAGAITLNPGEGFFLDLSAAVGSLTFTGTPHVPVLPAALPCGFGQQNYLSRQTNGIGTYENIIGAAPQEGSEVEEWNGTGFTINTFTGGAWTSAAPSLAVGQAAVFYIPSGSTNENASFVYQGLTNTSLGHAALAVSGNELDVTGLDTNGSDGVGIAMPSNLAGFDVSWQALDVSNTLPVGAYVQEQISGATGTGTNGVWGTVTMTKAGTSNYVVSADYSAVGASTYTVQAYLKEVLVGQATGQSGASLVVCGGWGTSYDWEFWPNFGPTIDWGNDTPILLGGSALTCDRLYIIPEGVSITNAPTAMQITASQVPGLTITSENASFVYQGLTNTSLGHAALAVSGNELDVTGLDTNGSDGVGIAMPSNLAGFDVSWQALDVSNTLPVGAYVQEQISGATGTGTNGVWGTVTMTKAGTSNYVVSADYSAVGASTYTVQAYLKEVLVGQATGQSGASLVVCGGWGTSYDWEFWPNFGPTIDWGNDTPILLGGSALTCDRLYIIPEGVSITNAPTAMQITASQVPGLTITSENASFVYQGLTNTSLGHAALAVSGSELDVTDLGSGGHEGVSIAWPSNLTGLDVGWQQLDPSNALPVGSYIQEGVVGTANGITNGVLGTLTVTKTGDTNFLLSADYSPLGASTYTVQAYRNGVLVAQATNLSGSSLGEVDGDEPILTGGSSVTYTPNSSGGWTITLSAYVDGSLIDWLSVLGDFLCDHVVITPETALYWPSGLTAMQITASQIPSIIITSENVTAPFAGFSYTSLGNATLTVSGSELVVSNIGSSGQDGFTLANTIADGAAKGQATDLTCVWMPLTNTSLVGAYIQSQSIGTANGITNGILGTLTDTEVCAVCGGSNYLVSADFSPLGASNYTVQAYYQGVLMAQATNQNGVAFAHVNMWPIGKDLGDIITPLSDEYPPGALLTIVGMAPVACDRLVVTPNNVPGPINPTAFSIVASQLPSVTITAVTVSPLLINLSQTGPNIMLQWYGTYVLQGSTDLSIWTDITNAISPYAVAPKTSGPAKFFRLIFRP